MTVHPPADPQGEAVALCAENAGYLRRIRACAVGATAARAASDPHEAARCHSRRHGLLCLLRANHARIEHLAGLDGVPDR